MKAMSDLIQNIDANHIIISYNNEGIISEEEMINLIKKHTIPNTIDIVRIPCELPRPKGRGFS